MSTEEVEDTRRAIWQGRHDEPKPSLSPAATELLAWIKYNGPLVFPTSTRHPLDMQWYDQKKTDENGWDIYAACAELEKAGLVRNATPFPASRATWAFVIQPDPLGTQGESGKCPPPVSRPSPWVPPLEFYEQWRLHNEESPREIRQRLILEAFTIVYGDQVAPTHNGHLAALVTVAEVRRRTINRVLDYLDDLKEKAEATNEF